VLTEGSISTGGCVLIIPLPACRNEVRARDPAQAGEFERRFAALREEHLRKPSLIARLDRAGLNA
jgi:hypothetical protein